MSKVSKVSKVAHLPRMRIIPGCASPLPNLFRPDNIGPPRNQDQICSDTLCSRPFVFKAYYIRSKYTMAKSNLGQIHTSPNNSCPTRTKANWLRFRTVGVKQFSGRVLPRPNVFRPTTTQANSPLTTTFRPTVFQTIYYLGQALLIHPLKFWDTLWPISPRLTCLSGLLFLAQL